MGRRGGGKTTIREVAAHAGVSVATVSRVLNGTYAAPPATRERVLRAVAELEYVASANARQLAAPSGLIALVVNDITAPFFMTVASGVEEQAAADGRVCLVCSTRGSSARELAMVNLMRRRGAEAVVLVGGTAESPEHLAGLADRAAALRRDGGRLVLCGRAWRGPAAPVLVVDYDVEAGAFAATNHLLSAGHTRVAHLAGPGAYRVAGRRAEGYRRALRAHGLAPDPELLVEGDLTRRQATLAARRLLTETDATAVFAANDLSAAGVFAAARELGRRVPEELSVVGFDDIPLAEDLVPRLTTVHVPQRELGRVAARLALREDTGEAEPVVLGTHVVVRDSVAPPPRLAAAR